MSVALLSILLVFTGMTSRAQTENKPGEATDTLHNGSITADVAFASNLRVDVDTFHLRIIPPASGVRFYGKNIVFLKPTKELKRMSPGHLAFGNIEAWYAPFGDSVIADPQPFSPFTTTSFSFPPDGLTIGADKKIMYFTRIDAGDEKEKIYKANGYTAGNGVHGWSWGNEPLNFCKTGYRFTHPSLSKDGSILVFASDLP